MKIILDCCRDYVKTSIQNVKQNRHCFKRNRLVVPKDCALFLLLQDEEEVAAEEKRSKISTAAVASVAAAQRSLWKNFGCFVLLSLIRLSIKWRKDACDRNKEPKSLIIIYLQFIFDRKCRCNHTSPFLPKFSFPILFPMPKRYFRLFFLDFSAAIASTVLVCTYSLVSLLTIFSSIVCAPVDSVDLLSIDVVVVVGAAAVVTKIQIYIQALLSRAIHNYHTYRCIALYCIPMFYCIVFL